MSNIKNKIIEVLKQDERLWNESKTELNETLLIDLVENIDEKVIDLLLQEKDLREKFFVKIKDVYVFKTNEFKFFIEENKIDNSFTQYKNRIGLTDGKRFIKDTDDIVLNWPYKDCILEGGQSTEEGTDTYFEYEEEKIKTINGEKVKQEAGYKEKQAKRKEIFFNQVLAHDEIDRLLDEKALVNWKRFTKTGEKEVKEIKRDAEINKKRGLPEDTITENLIIKGNNLLALSSLEKEFAGKVKLIYIDPPYNTGGDKDSFTYNNNFNHSTWLTFMKNRLEIAKNFLRDDGFIAIAIDHVELFYLGTLADEIFGRDNRVGIVSIIHKPEGRSQEKFFGASNEFMLVYAKNKKIANFNKVILSKEKLETFNLIDEKGRYKLRSFIRGEGLREKKPNLFYPIYVSKDLKDFKLEKQEGYYEVLPISGGVERTWFLIKESFLEKVKNNEIVAKIDKNGNVKIYYKVREVQVYTTHWIDKRYNYITYGTKLLEKVIGRKGVSFPKSLYVVQDTIKIMTSKNDIIMDFHAGSGTTGHAVLELNKNDGGNRQFILIEQLEEHIKVCNERNQKVLNQKNINNSFIYFELAKWNEKAKEEILNKNSLEELVEFFDEMYEKYFLNYNLKIKEFKEKVINEEEFKKLSLDEQKKMFIAMLDNNQMYVNKSEMEDSKFGISPKDIELTKQFYNSEK